MAVSQLVRRTDGSTRAREVPGEIRYVRTETHDHWHLLGFEVYELRKAGDGALVRPQREDGLLSRGPATRRRKARRSRAKPAEAVWIDECGRDQPGLLRLRQGISPGFGDDYEPGREGQFVDVTNVPAGRYLLVHRANPERAHPGGELREQRRLRAHPAAPVRGHPHRPRSRTLPERRDVPARPGNRLEIKVALEPFPAVQMHARASIR